MLQGLFLLKTAFIIAKMLLKYRLFVFLDSGLIGTASVLEVSGFSWKYLSVCQHAVIQDLKTALCLHQEKDITFLSNHGRHPRNFEADCLFVT